MICLVVGVFTLVILPCQIYFLLIQRIRMLLQKRTAANTKRTAQLCWATGPWNQSTNEVGEGIVQRNFLRRRGALNCIHCTSSKSFPEARLSAGKFQRRPPIKYNAILLVTLKTICKRRWRKMMQQNSRFTHRRLFRAKLDFALLKKNSKRNWSHFVHSKASNKSLSWP